MIGGSELGEHPYEPITHESRRRAVELGDALPVEWRHRDERYAEKLATPDTSVADLIGDVDPMKVAEGRSLGDPDTIHFGLIPRSHRGIVAINELPDLAERIQVAMLNVMEERDIQIRGYVLRLPLDVLVVASANPEDYTNRGRIITPLKDRFGAEIRTHYPTELEDEIAVIRQEAHLVADVPDHLVEILARFTGNLRESVVGRPALGRLGAVRDRRRRDDRGGRAAPRHLAGRGRGGRARRSTSRPRSTCSAARSSSRPARRVARPRSSPTCSARPPPRRSGTPSAGLDFALLVDALESGMMVTTGEQVTARDFLTGLPVLGESELYDEICDRLGATNDGQRAGAIELALEGLYLARKISKESGGGETSSMANRHTSNQVRSRYGRYGGGDPLAPPVDIAEALDAIGQDVMAGYSPERAMREFLRRGGQQPARPRRPGPPGRRAAPRAAAAAQPRRHPPGDPGAARQGGARGAQAAGPRRRPGRRRPRVARDAAGRTCRRTTAAAVSELSSYDWQSREAREDYEQIKDLLGRELLDQRFAGHEAGARERHRRGPRGDQRDAHRPQRAAREAQPRARTPQEDFDEFMAKHGDFFPENPQNLDELLDAMAARAAAAQRMLNSMSAEQRAELMQLSQQAFGSPALMESLARLDSNLQSLRPGEDWSGSERMDGDQGLGLGDGTGVFQDLADLDELAEQLSQSYGGARMDDLDLDTLARQLGDDARGRRADPAGARAGAARRRHPAPRLRRQPPAHPEGDAPARQGAAARRGREDVRPPGPARAAPGRRGRRAARAPPAQWEFGDTEPWHVPRTITNAVVRTRRRGAATRAPAYASRSTTSRSRRPRPAPRRAWRCSSTRRSRWRWTAAGCR